MCEPGLHCYEPHYISRAYPYFECTVVTCKQQAHNATCIDDDGHLCCMCGLEDMTKWERQFAKEGTS